MIAKLTGIIEHILDDSIILNTGGVGYLVTVPSYIFHQSKEGDHISLFIETLIRPEMITLYGFQSINEKSLFQKLMSVQGIGGKSASAILSVMVPDQIIEAIINHDAAAFKKADGIGPKVATRIVTELKDYAEKQKPLIASQPQAISSSIQMSDALSTLIQLGYKRNEAQQALQKAAINLPNGTTSQLVPAALKLLAQNII